MHLAALALAFEVATFAVAQQSSLAAKHPTYKFLHKVLMVTRASSSTLQLAVRWISR
jgi:hypothetical protein